MTRNECVRALKEEYANRRANREAEADQRFKEVSAADPAIADLRSDNALLALNTLKSIGGMKDDAQRREAVQKMRDQGIANNLEIERRLIALGHPADYLSVRYDCPVCRDTGLVGDAPARFCDCFERRVRQMMYESGLGEYAGRECFETFDADRFPEEDGQRTAMLSVRKVCEQYADTYPDTRFKNLVLTGAGGLGKTFLLNSIYTRITERGGEAVRITAYRLFEAMRRQYFADDSEEMEFETLLKVPVLLIDDLGTEPMMRNITIESLFTLLNERVQAGRHTVISTNLSPLQVQEKYGERVMSRMFDRTRCATILLKGKDLRKL